MEGRVKFYIVEKGYGFITERETHEDYFVHRTNTLDRIVKDDIVEFDVESGKRGPKAVNVHRKKT
jgi:CspA family cold shock protein